MVEDFRESVRERVRMVPHGPVPVPWRQVAPVPVGGLTEVGVDSTPSGEEFVLAVSGTGRVLADGRVLVIATAGDLALYTR